MKNSDFYLLTAARAVSMFGSILVFYAVPLLIYTQYHSGMILAMFELASLIPSIALGVPVGMWMKNKNVKSLWVRSSALLGAYSLFVFFFMNPITLFFLNLISSVLFIIVGIASQSLMPEVVEKDELSWANSVRILVTGTVAAAVPAIAGFILSWAPRVVFLIDSITFFVEISLILKIKKDAPAMGEKKEKIRKIFAETIGYMRSVKIIRNSAILLFVMLIISGSLKILNIAYFTQLFSSPYEYYGIAATISQAGMLTIIIPSTFHVIKFKAPYRALLLSLVLYALYFALMAILQVSILIMAAFFILGLGNGVASPNTISVFQMNADKAHLRQVLGVVGTLIDAARITSVIMMGIMVDILPLRYIYLALATSLIALFMVFAPSALRTRLKSKKKLNNGSKRYP